MAAMAAPSPQVLEVRSWLATQAKAVDRWLGRHPDEMLVFAGGALVFGVHMAQRRRRLRNGEIVDEMPSPLRSAGASLLALGALAWWLGDLIKLHDDRTGTRHPVARIELCPGDRPGRWLAFVPAYGLECESDLHTVLTWCAGQIERLDAQGKLRRLHAVPVGAKR
jgi:hypothetical protein